MSRRLARDTGRAGERPARRPREAGPRRRGSWRRHILRALLVAVACGVAATLLPLLVLRFAPPPTTSWMIQRQIEAWRSGDRDFTVRYRWVPWERIAPALPIAIVAAEDQKFPVHSGFDWTSMAAALRERRERVRGASTLSQQLAKNLFLWPERSLLRKGLEAWFTLWLELCWSKRRILEVYLNVVEFGPGLFGVAAASEAHFGKTPDRISAREAALLAAVLPNPLRFDAARPTRYVLERAAHIERQVAALGGPSYLAAMR